MSAASRDGALLAVVCCDAALSLLLLPQPVRSTAGAASRLHAVRMERARRIDGWVMEILLIKILNIG